MTPEELLTALRECDVRVAHHVGPKRRAFNPDWFVETTTYSSAMLIEGDPETIRWIEAMLKGGEDD